MKCRKLDVVHQNLPVMKAVYTLARAKTTATSQNRDPLHYRKVGSVRWLKLPEFVGKARAALPNRAL